MPPPSVFLSHVGADTAPARALAERLVRAGHDVWFDKTDLRPRTKGWQRQIADAIAAADAFVVYVGARGIVNWVEAAVLAGTGDADAVRRALRYGLDSARTRTLLIVDQVDELFAPPTPEDARTEIAALLAALANRNDPRVTVAIAMRGDYTNLLRGAAVRPLYERLEADGWRLRQTLGRIAARDPRDPEDQREPDGLSAVVVKPIRLAGCTEHKAQALADLVAADVCGRPGDLALVQFALVQCSSR